MPIPLYFLDFAEPVLSAVEGRTQQLSDTAHLGSLYVGIVRSDRSLWAERERSRRVDGHASNDPYEKRIGMSNPLATLLFWQSLLPSARTWQSKAEAGKTNGQSCKSLAQKKVAALDVLSPRHGRIMVN